MREKWRNISIQEKETIINFDYCDKSVSIYTSNNSVGKRIEKKIGEPRKKGLVKGEICSEEWKVSFEDREKIKKILSINNFVSSYLSDSQRGDSINE